MFKMFIPFFLLRFDPATLNPEGQGNVDAGRNYYRLLSIYTYIYMRLLTLAALKIDNFLTTFFNSQILDELQFNRFNVQ